MFIGKDSLVHLAANIGGKLRFRADTDGDNQNIKVEFTAVPDRTVPAKNEPVFNYTIHSDVTDTTGETRSEDTSVRVGYTALQASVAAAEWQTPEKPVELVLSTSSLDGVPQSAAGTMKVFALRQPTAVQRAALQQERFWWWGGDAEPQPDPTKPESWALGAVMTE